MKYLALVLLWGCATQKPYVRMEPADNYEPYARHDVAICFDAPPVPPAQDDEVLWYPVPGCLKECVVAQPEPTIQHEDLPWLRYEER